jgi:hypothetical protein
MEHARQHEAVVCITAASSGSQEKEWKSLSWQTGQQELPSTIAFARPY